MNARTIGTPHRTLLWRLALAIMALALCAPGVARAQAPPTPIQEYWAQVEATYAAVQAMSDASRAERAARLALLAEPWQQITQVALGDGAVVAVDNRALTRALLADPPNLTRVEGMLSALLAARDQWPLGGHSAADLRSLETILRRAEFQVEPATPSRLAQWWEDLLERIDRFLARLLPESSAGGAGRVLAALLNLAGVIALAALVAYTVNQLLLSLAAEAHLRMEGGDGGALLTADSAFQRAQELAEGRDYRTAVRYLYLSTLLTLDERGLLRYDRSKTNREYLRSVASQPALAATLREVIDVFDRVWYGFQPLDAASYARYETRVAELRQP